MYVPSTEQSQQWIELLHLERSNGKLVLSCRKLLKVEFQHRMAGVLDFFFVLFCFVGRRGPVRSGSIWLELVCTGSARIFCSSDDSHERLGSKAHTSNTQHEEDQEAELIGEEGKSRPTRPLRALILVEPPLFFLSFFLLSLLFTSKGQKPPLPQLFHEPPSQTSTPSGIHPSGGDHLAPLPLGKQKHE